MDLDVERKLREALLRTYFENRSVDFPASPADQRDLEDHVHVRFRECEEFVLPWVESQVDLREAEVLEIGCGTGSSTASFAGRAGYVYGYDIVDRSVRAANERLHIMGISNAQCWASPPSALLERLARDHADGVDVVLLYAVMEHQTLDERLATLETVWRLLRPGGHLVVTDSPNRLCYKHYHTSEVPFLDMLPLRLVWSQLGHSPRIAFRESMSAALSQSEARAEEVLARWGTGISYHEFEAVLGPLEGLVVGDGFDPEIAAHKPLVIEEELLLSYLVLTEQPVPLGFARVSVDVILRKPGVDHAEPFRSRGEDHIPRIRQRFGRLSGAMASRVASDGTPGQHEGEASASAEHLVHPARLDYDWACRVAEESLNGRTLLQLSISKLVRKLTGRGDRKNKRASQRRR